MVGRSVILAVVALIALTLVAIVGVKMAETSSPSTTAAGITGLAGGPLPGAPTNVCILDYERADNAYADVGRADGDLGVESITVIAGQTRVFITDWAYEKKRNDGIHHYGSHLRIAENRGRRRVDLRLRQAGFLGVLYTSWYQLDTYGGKSYPWMKTAGDLMEVRCPG